MTAVSLHPSVVTTEVEGEAYLLNIDSGAYLRVSGAGGAIVGHLAAPITVAGIVGLLLQEFDVSETEAEEETRRFVEELDAAGMLEKA